MRPSAQRLRSILLASAGASLILGALHGIYFDPLRKAETYTRDLRQCWGRKAERDPQLVFLAIDKNSVQLDTLFPDEVEASPALKLMKAGFPWSREVYALVTERLLQAGARIVCFDLLFPSPAPGDSAFRETLGKYPDRVLAGCDFVSENDGRGLSWRLDLPVETLFPRTRPLDPRLGYVTFWSDPDGSVRRARFQTSLEEMAGESKPSGEIFLSLEARILRGIGRADLVPPAGDRLFRFAGGPRTFESRSIYEIFVPEMWTQNFQDGAFFKNKIVFIGPEGSWSHDEHATPFRIIDGRGALMPGPEIHLNALNAALHSDYLSEPEWAEQLLALVLAGILGAALSLPRGPIVRAIFTGGALVAYGQICLLAYNRAGLLLLVILPSAIVGLTVALNIMADYRRERKEKDKIRSTLGQYVGENVVTEILRNPGAYLHSLAGVRKPVTVLFSDLRDFTSLTAKRPPPELIAQLNEYFSVMTEAVLAENGTVDKFVGDGMMAVWGNLRTDGPAADAQAALRCTLAMREGLARLNAKWLTEGWPVLRFGVGLNHGEATIGHVGSERKMDFTAIGEVVNTASRIEQLTSQLAHDILIGEPVAALAGDAFEIEPGGAVQVKGIAQPLPVFLLQGFRKSPMTPSRSSRPPAPALAHSRLL